MANAIFWGATGQAKVLYELIGYSGLVALIDNRDIQSPIPGIPLYVGESGLRACLQDLQGKQKIEQYAVAIGGDKGRDRLEIMNLLDGFDLIPLTLIHRQAFVANCVCVGDGSQILAMAAVCANAEIGRGVIINTGAQVDHDCKIGDGVHVGPGAKLAGEITVENCAFIGTGAVVLPRLTIGHDAIVGAGAVVTKDVSPKSVVIGCPARDINYYQENKFKVIAL